MTNFGIKNVCWELLLSENVRSAFPKFRKTVENIAKEAIKARVIDVKITWVSNYRCPIWKCSNRTPVIGHPRDRASITLQVGTRRTNHDREFCYRYDYYHNRIYNICNWIPTWFTRQLRALWWISSQCFAQFSTSLKSATDIFAQKNLAKDNLIPKFVIDTIN